MVEGMIRGGLRGCPERYETPKRSCRESIPAYCRAWMDRKGTIPEAEREKLRRLCGTYLVPLGEKWYMKELDDGFRNAFLKELDRKHAPAESREIMIGLLRDVSEEAVRRRIIRYNPFLEIPPGGSRGKKYPALSKEEIRRLLKLDPRVAEHACLQVQLLTGMRPAEARGLCWEDIDEDGRAIQVRHQLRAGKTEPVPGTKNYRFRRINPPLLTFEILGELREGREEPGRLVFVDSGGRPMNGGKLNRLLKDLLGRESVRLHDLRVTHGTMLYEVTRDLHAVSRRLGHSDTEVTERHYVDMKPDLRGALAVQNQYYKELIEDGEKESFT